MNKKIILIIVLVMSLLLVNTYKVQLVGADSGFDSSFDSGGSDFGGSSDWGDSSSSGGGSGDPFVMLMLVYIGLDVSLINSIKSKAKQKKRAKIGFIAILFLIILLEKLITETIISFIAILLIENIAPLFIIKWLNVQNKSQTELINRALNSKLELLDINKFNEEKRIEIEAYNIYKSIQYAWMNFDEELLRKCTTDEMYNMYLMQLDTLKVKNQKNIMYDIKYLSSNIKEEFEENGQQTIVMNMEVSCYDFIINTTTNNVVRGNAFKRNTYLYELTFVKTVNNKSTDKCPQCGAPVEANNSGVCEYCKSTLISSEYTLVMSKKKMISQK